MRKKENTISYLIDKYLWRCRRPKIKCHYYFRLKRNNFLEHSFHLPCEETKANV